MSFHVGDQVVVKRDIVRAEGLYAKTGEYGTIMEIMRVRSGGPNNKPVVYAKVLMAYSGKDNNSTVVKTFRLSSLMPFLPI